jgi:Domain of unknown function (DUF4157)/D-alanyl-D-alanine carboxypeptidase/Zinc carboxypeptidase
VSGPPPITHATPVPAANAPALRRVCSCPTTSSGTTAECAECRKEATLHRSPYSTPSRGTRNAPETVHRVLGSAGEPLALPTRALMEQRLGHDFGHVRVHADAEAARSAKEVHARAYTVGHHVVLGSGEGSPHTESGFRTLAHELVHVAQQSAVTKVPESLPVISREDESERHAEGVARSIVSGHSTEVTGTVPACLARVPLPVAEIAQDVRVGARTHPDLFSWLHVRGDRSGEVGFGAATRSQTPPAAPAGAASPSGTPAAPATVPTDPRLRIEGHFFPSFLRHTDQKALILGGFHGDERPGYQIADAFVSELQTGTITKRQLRFHTLIIPRVNPGGIERDLGQAPAIPNITARCNNQGVDLNRNYLRTSSASSKECPHTRGAPEQPETAAIRQVISDLQPHRILSMHSISSPAEAGVFADPVGDAPSEQLACSMAGLIVDPRNRRGNQVTGRRCNPVYGGPPTGPTSLGRYGPTSVPGQVTPTITLEAPEHRKLGTTDHRTTSAFLPAVRSFVVDPAILAADSPDTALLRDIEALSQPSLFLTGRLSENHEILKRVKTRIDAKIAELNALGPPTPVRDQSGDKSGFRGFSGPGGQADILFEKFFLVGGRSNGWDTLPDRYFNGPNRTGGVNRSKWLAEPSADRLRTILQYTAIPGASRHHWGTDVDFNSDKPADWRAGTPAPAGGGAGQKPGRFAALGTWLAQNAPSVGFRQAYTAGRTAGHSEEPWHWSYAPLALPIRRMYERQVNLPTDVVAHLLRYFQTRATAKRVQVPADFAAALRSLNISEYVSTVGPGL